MKLINEVEISDERIRMERAKLHISQKELAIRTGITREKIMAIENAKCKNVEKETLEKLAKEFNVELNELFKKEKR